jgi:hypothetical protein
MIRREADGYYVELRAQRYGRPVGPAIRWGSYPDRRTARVVEDRNRAKLAAQGPTSRRRTRTTSPQLRLLDAS